MIFDRIPHSEDDFSPQTTPRALKPKINARKIRQSNKKSKQCTLTQLIMLVVILTIIFAGLLIFYFFYADNYVENQQKMSKFIDYLASPNEQQYQWYGGTARKTKQKYPKIASGQMYKADISNEQKLNAMELLKLKEGNEAKSKFLIENEREYYENKYKLSSFTNQIPICAVIPSYNNQNNKRYLYNIQSILRQEYQNYQIVFIDDASTDNTYELVTQYLQNQRIPKEKYIAIKNKQQMRAMRNLRRAAKQMCRNDSIFIVIDGDDELIGTQVFKLYNAVFQDKGVWFMYSNFVDLNRKSIGYSRRIPDKVMQKNQYRSVSFVTSHLRAFYTSLFNRIYQQDLKATNSNKYYETANDVAICIPILQMSHMRVIYIPELTYAYNSNTGLNNHILRVRVQKGNDQQVRRKKKYFPLKTLFDQITRREGDP